MELTGLLCFIRKIHSTASNICQNFSIFHLCTSSYFHTFWKLQEPWLFSITQVRFIFLYNRGYGLECLTRKHCRLPIDFIWMEHRYLDIRIICYNIFDYSWMPMYLVVIYFFNLCCNSTRLEGFFRCNVWFEKFKFTSFNHFIFEYTKTVTFIPFADLSISFSYRDIRSNFINLPSCFL